jgi:hypothetical protein
MTVNLSMLAGAGAQFFDNSGVILSGGLVYTYAAGTTTPQAAYTTSSGSTAHTNPIVLDSAGRVPSGGEIWLTDAVAYKFLLKTSAAVTIGTYDNVTGNSSGISSSLAASSGSSLVGFIQSGTGAVATTVQSKLRESVSVMDFGAVGDGVTNDAAAIQLALNTGKSVLIPSGTFLFGSTVSFTADNQCIYGVGNTSILKSGPNSVYINSVGFDNLTVRDLKIVGTGTNGGITITSSSQNFDVLNVYFYEGGQRVWLFTCDHVTVQNCTFDGTGYGVIAEYGYASSNVLIDGNIAQNMQADFVEANTAAASPQTSEFWTISNNIYTGAQDYPTAATEKRFVGITSVRGVVISGNSIKKSTGDAPIHLEDTLGETIISDNIFDNCVLSGGNEGYIYLLNSAENVIISGNIFLRTDTSLGLAYAVGTSSGGFTNDIQFIGNRVLGNGSAGNFGGVSYSSQGSGSLGNFNCTGNIFKSLTDGIAFGSAENALISSNTFSECNAGIRFTQSTSNVGGIKWLVANNVFNGTVGTRDIFTTTNTNGTGNPQKWTVTGNVFAKEMYIANSIDTVVTNNTFQSGASLNLAGSATRSVAFGNVFQDPATNVTATAPSLPNYANDAAAAVGLIPVGGMYRNGSVVQVRVT